MTFGDVERSRSSCGASLGCSMPPHAVDCKKLTRNTAKRAVIACFGGCFGRFWRVIVLITIGLYTVILSAQSYRIISWR
jgi:hypothetical protein